MYTGFIIDEFDNEVNCCFFNKQNDPIETLISKKVFENEEIIADKVFEFYLEEDGLKVLSSDIELKVLS